MTKPRDLSKLGGGFIQSGTGAVQRSVESKLKDTVSVKDFGAVGDGVADDTAAIQAAVAAHGTIYFPQGTYRLTSTLNLRQRTILAEEAGFTCDHAGIGIILGGNSASADNSPQKVRSVFRVSGDYTIPVVRIIGAKNQLIWLKRCPYVQLYADTDVATDTSCAYSSFWFNWVEKLELNTNPSPAGSTTQWINQNNFYLDRIISLTVAGTYPHNNNKFLRGAFEAGTLNFQTGAANRVEGLRGEGGCNITFAAGTANNVVLTDWNSSGRDYTYTVDSFVITDDGGGNYVGHQREIDTPMFPVTGFTHTNLKLLSNGTFNVPGVSNVGLTSTNFSVTAFQEFYRTGIIPCPKAGVDIFAQLIGRTVGGYRVTVIGYDSNGTPLASTGADFNVRGVGNTGFGSYAPATPDSAVGSLNAWVQSTTAAAIDIVFVASANGLTATGFAVSLRNNNKSQIPETNAVTGAFVAPNSSLSKVVGLTDNVQSNIFTFAIPAVSTSQSNVSLGFEVNYVIRTSRVTSTRAWSAQYGKVYGVISRGWESNANAAPLIAISTADQLLAGAGAAPTVTWAATLDAGADNAAKNGYLAVTVDNPYSATNATSIAATVTFFQGGTSLVTVS